MGLLNILQFPDPRLKRVAEEVREFDQSLFKLIDDMFETMYETQGVGLAATQVNDHRRVITMDVTHENTQPIYLINPEIIHKENLSESEEGCLSFPGVYAKVKRAKKIRVKFLDKHQKVHELEAEGLLAVCIQHETDHLHGITFYDHLSPLKKELLRKKLKKMRDRAL